MSKSKSSAHSQMPDSEKEVSGKRTYASVRKRHEEIVELLLERGYVTVEYLANIFNVTPQTIRRDIKSLSEAGRIRHYHGGAGVVMSTENYAYSDRKVLCLKEKQRIAKLVAKHVPDHASLFMNLGTTTEEVAKALANHRGLRIITNNLNVAAILGSKEELQIIVAGGLLRHKDCGITGEATIDFIRQFKVDIGIIGISGIDQDGDLLDFDYREVRAARAIIDNSRRVFLVTDHTKFGRNAMVRLGTISEISALFTDRKPPAPLVEILEAADVELFVAEHD